MDSEFFPYRDISKVRKRLNHFSCLSIAPQLNSSETEQIKADLKQFNELSDYQTLGVCADSLSTGKTALISYLEAFGVLINLDLPEHKGPVYIKFNTLKGTWYLDQYNGNSRGVLITFHSSEPEAIELVGTYGPFPLDLFS